VFGEVEKPLSHYIELGINGELLANKDKISLPSKTSTGKYSAGPMSISY
jgi:hypothetical protein